MILLHTSDWHLGKRLIERERLPEQIEVLDELAAVCDEKQVDIVLIAGDVFDTYLPPAEAEEVFYRAVKKLAGEGRAVVIVSGNHDDGVRLSAAAPLAGLNGIYLFGGHSFRPAVQSGRLVHAIEAGENFLILEKGEERVYINALPYPNEARLKEEKTEESYAEKALRWIRAGEEHYRGDMPYILLTHLFIAGGSVSSSERDITLGGARAVPASELPPYGYTALGHLHKRQKVGQNARYSGSILQYSFDEAGIEKGVVLLETRGNTVSVKEEIPLTKGKRLARLEADSVPSALSLLSANAGKLIELTLRLKAPLTASETEALRAHEGLISLHTEVSCADTPVVSRKNLSAEELFREYYRTKFGADASDELAATFLRLLGEAEA